MEYYYRTRLGFGRPWTPAVRWLILACGGVFLLQLAGFEDLLLDIFGLNTALVLPQWRIWQLATYLFLHGGIFHLFFNMFALWMFGAEVEEFLGTRRFLIYYFFTGVGAALCVLAVDVLITGHASLTVGASGAIFGILMAYGLLFARRRITLLVFLVIPITMEARIFVIVFAVMELLLGVSGGSTVSHFAHLGGMAAGYIYFKAFLREGVRRGPSGGFWSSLAEWFPLRGVGDRERLDQILDKINRYGIHTLSARERRFLNKMSQRRQ